MSKEVLIRVDGNSEIGFGHVVRCLSLAKLPVYSDRPIFVIKDSSDEVEKLILENGFQVKKLSSEEDFFNLLNDSQLVVLDHYGLSSSFQKNIKSYNCPLIVIDDLHDKETYADVVINHSPAVNECDYRAQPYTRFGLGLSYSLLRKSFIDAAKEELKRNDSNSVFISFGGADPMDFTRQVLEVTKNVKEIDQIIVVVGGGYKNWDQLSKSIFDDSHILLHKALSEEEMVNVMKSSSIAIVPTSSVLLEAIAVGCRPFATYYAENQKELFSFFERGKEIKTFNVKNFNEEKFALQLTELLNESNIGNNDILRRQISHSYENLCELIKNYANGNG